MRKSLSVAICAVMLACAGISQASIDSKSLAPISDSVSAKFQQVSRFMDGGGSNGFKTEVAYKSNSDRTASKVPEASENDGNQAMLIAGLMIMGVIIKRRYGKND